MSSNPDHRSYELETRMPGRVGGNPAGLLSGAGEIRRFRVEHALQAIENALILLDSRPAEGLEITALERVRDDLAVLLRAARSS